MTGIGRNAARLRTAKTLGAIDEATTDLAEGVRDADAVVLAVPVEEVIPLGKKIRPRVKPGAFVIDVGSVKGAVVRAFSGWPDFVGSHPMCGSEKTGVRNARPDLYRGAACLLTPTGKTSKSALAKAESLWKSVGAKPLRLSPEEHDRRVALVSHLPHLLAEALVRTATEGDGKNWAPRTAAGSFLDATRVASADPALWAQIFAMNRASVRRAAAAFRRALAALLSRGPGERELREVVRRRNLFGGLS